MIIYFIILIFICILTYKYDIRKELVDKNNFFWITCLIFILLSGLRYKIGGDTVTFMPSFKEYPDICNFNWIKDISNFKESALGRERYKEGWIFFVMLCKGIYNNYFFLQFIISLIFNISIFITIKNYAKFPFLTVLIYYTNFKFFELEFETLRESLAISTFLLISLNAFLKRKWIRFYMGSIIASMFHPAAYITFLLPFIRKFNLNLKQIFIYLIVPTIIIGLIGKTFFGSFINVIFPSEGFTASYVTKAVEKSHNLNYILLHTYNASFFAFVLTIGWKYLKHSKFLSIFVLTICLCYFNIIAFTFSRIADLFIIIVFILIAEVLYSIYYKKRSYLIPIFLIFIFNVPTFIIFRTNESRARYFPYQTILMPDQTNTQRKINLR